MALSDARLPANSAFLVTGGAGFIGSHLCEELLRRGHAVRCLDDLSTGSRANIDALANEAGFEFVEGDVRDARACERACSGVDYVLHQAAWGSVPRSIEMPLHYEDVNVRGTLQMMEAARGAQVKAFVYASSSSVYGDAARLPKREGAEGRVLSPYALTKRVDEEYGRLYHRLYGLPAIALRYFNVFGPRQNPEGPYAAVIPRFIDLMLRGQSPVIEGDGSQSRDFTYVENVVEANLRACTAGPAAWGRAFNVAAGDRHRVVEAYRAIARRTGFDGQPRFAPARRGDIPHSFADISAARDALGYDPAVGFEEGLDRTLAWRREAGAR